MAKEPAGDEAASADAAFDYIKAVHADYQDALKRLQESSEILQSDFKMLVVTLPLLTGAVAGLGGAVEVGGIKLPTQSATAPNVAQTGLSFTFWAFAALTTLVAVVGFRDFTRAVGFEHQLYTVVRYERHFVRLVRRLVPAGAGPQVTPAAYFVDKFRQPLSRVLAAASVVYSIPTLIAPVAVLWLSHREREALILFGYAGSLTLAYTLVGQLALRRFSDLFSSVTPQALERDDPEPNGG